jgi:CubicO group peptidase (beta-lactamase class C family)
VRPPGRCIIICDGRLCPALAQSGTEGEASWTIDGTGQEVTYCCFNAVLRDYARFGRLLAHDGAWNGLQIVPRQWLIDATTVRPSDAHLGRRVQPRGTSAMATMSGCCPEPNAGSFCVASAAR